MQTYVLVYFETKVQIKLHMRKQSHYSRVSMQRDSDTASLQARQEGNTKHQHRAGVSACSMSSASPSCARYSVGH